MPETLVGGRSVRVVPDEVVVEPVSRSDGVVAITVPDFAINTILVFE